jgi:GNAT superfamily N-acetyltransferase
MLSCLIRRFEPADQGGVERLVLTIQQDEYGYQLTTENQPDLKDVAGFFAGGPCAMRKFMVAAHARGRDKGVSAALTRAFEAHARQHCPKLALSTVEKTIAAQAFYVREGYRVVDQSQMPEGFEAGPFDVVFMVKDLAKQPPAQ